MITLIGLGLHDEKDVTLRGVELAKAADRVYMELYTSKWHGSIKNLEKIVGKKIEALQRKDLEEDAKKIIELARKQNIVIFVPGDPLVATTHTTLIQSAVASRIDYNIVHNASIISAVAESGLHIYKFGPSVTIPFPEKTKGRLPESVYEVLKTNLARGLHTLCLLDVVSEENKYMLPKQAAAILLDLEKVKKENVCKEKTEVVVMARMGSSDAKIFFGKIGEVLKKDFGEPPMVLIVPGSLHFTEKEHLQLYKKV